MTRYIRNYLANDANRTQLLPANSGIESANIESQIAEYNKQLLQRNSLVANSSAENRWSWIWIRLWHPCVGR